MSTSLFAEVTSSIDEVIQSGKPLSDDHNQQKRGSLNNPSTTSLNRNSPLSRNPLVKVSTKEYKPSSRPATSHKRRGEQEEDYSVGRDDQNDPNSPTDTKTQKSEGKGSVGGGRLPVSTIGGTSLADFFSSEIFHIVLHNPTTAHRFLRFCQSRACGENMEFLQKVDSYNRLLEELSKTLGLIYSEYTSTSAPNQINLSHTMIKQLSGDLKQASRYTLPSLETIFTGAQEHVEKLLASDIYPRFVKYQLTASATMALSKNTEKFAGLGDCFCITDPHRADNPILFASDGFVGVTGYSRKDIIPRNCRFLQGKQTDPHVTRRLRNSIQQCEETVELLLNYRKNGDPFWNLLYCAPLFNEKGEVTYFLGGQINCSTTIHSCNDVLRILSINDDELEGMEQEARVRSSSVRSRETAGDKQKPRSAFFKSWKKYRAPVPLDSTKVQIQDEAGMEGELLNRVGKMNFKTQVEAFYTAYSKYLILGYINASQTLTVQNFSPGVIDMLCLNLPNGGVAPIHNKDIFSVLAEHTSPSSSTATKTLKQNVRAAIKAGKAISVETGLQTGFAEKKGGGWFGSNQDGLKRVEERYVTHWTPLKDEDGQVRRVVLTIAPKI